MPLRQDNPLERFERTVLPHLDAAYNLARWLTRSEHDAQDVVQEAYLRAFQFFGGFHGTDGRAWLLAIVRNTCYTWLQQNRGRSTTVTFDETIHSSADMSIRPDRALLQGEDRQLIRQALEELPLEFREVLVLRELEGLSYKAIAEIVGAPLGTVMSRLARGRERLEQQLVQRLKKDE
jgi:RNA polymerase sigma factor (sigma-70 family)